MTQEMHEELRIHGPLNETACIALLKGSEEPTTYSGGAHSPMTPRTRARGEARQHLPLVLALDFRGLASLLVLYAAVALLFTKKYPKGIFDFVLGMYRWTYRVAVYGGLMTDRYPPFQLGE